LLATADEWAVVAAATPGTLNDDIECRWSLQQWPATITIVACKLANATPSPMRIHLRLQTCAAALAIMIGHMRSGSLLPAVCAGGPAAADALIDVKLLLGSEPAREGGPNAGSISATYATSSPMACSSCSCCW
jgi:hypothetical protein